MKPLNLLFLGSALAFTNVQSQSCVPVCEAVGLSTELEWIQGVAIGPLTNLSGNDGGYLNFGNSSATYTAGNSYSYTIGVGYGDGPFSETFRGWMDFNQDGDFDDPGEEIFSDFGQFQVNGTFQIPSTAFNGRTTLRVTMGFAEADLCEDVASGEIEDYCINITGGVPPPPPPCDSSQAPTNLQVFFTGNFISLLWDGVTSSVGCQLKGGTQGNFDVVRNFIGSPSFYTFDYTSLPPGIYNWKIRCACSEDAPYDLTPFSEVSFFEIPEPGLTTSSNLEGESLEQLSLSPNPTRNNLRLEINTNSAGKSHIAIFDIVGRTVIEKDIDLQKGSNSFNLDVAKIPAGTYILTSISDHNGFLTEKFVKE